MNAWLANFGTLHSTDEIEAVNGPPLWYESDGNDFAKAHSNFPK